MRVAVSASSPSLDAAVDARFGRCAYFVIAETSTMEFEAMENPGGASAQGAGIATARMISEKSVQAVMTGNCGPNAYQTLNAAGIAVVTGVSGTVRQAIQGYREGSYQPTTAPNVASHFGTTGAQTQARGMGGAMDAIRPDTAPSQEELSLHRLLEELQGQIEGLRTQVQDLNTRIDDLHKND